MTHDPETIRRLVAEVIARITAPAAAPQAAAPATASTSGQPQATSGVVLADKVVTLASLERLPAGTARIVVAATAVITPSAREHARDSGIEIVRGGAAATAKQQASRPFIVAHAECGADAAGRCATIVRHVPGAQQLPATGLADVVAALATHAARDGARAILLSGRPAAAAVLANRSAGLRAVTARDAAGLLAAAAECSANLLVVDPQVFSAVALERVSGEFARRDLGPAPAELAAAPTPCACTGHAH
ncbi:MAG: hypothetical protein EBZ74_05160 [Planctomycetia bacterium]|nr:hypothetical protein [Planctomycetia bacterium]